MTSRRASRYCERKTHRLGPIQQNLCVRSDKAMVYFHVVLGCSAEGKQLSQSPAVKLREMGDVSFNALLFVVITPKREKIT